MWTSYHANVKNLPSRIIPVCISRGNASRVPLELDIVKPSPQLLEDYKKGEISREKYIEIYYSETLSRYSVDSILDELQLLIGNKSLDDVCLICYEGFEDKERGVVKFCHRTILSAYLNSGKNRRISKVREIII